MRTKRGRIWDLEHVKVLYNCEIGLIGSMTAKGCKRATWSTGARRLIKGRKRGGRGALDDW